MKKLLRSKLIFGFVVVAMLTAVAGVLGVPSSARASTTIRVQGAVSCDNHDFVGVWIQSSRGGSTFAAIYNTIASDGLFQRSIITTLPTYISLHVGCGKNSDGSWQSDNWTPYTYVTGPTTLTAACHEGNMSPHTATRCQYGYTAIEAKAYAWADAHYGSKDFYNLCVTYVRQAYLAAGIDIQSFTKIKFDNNTYPVDIWPAIWYGWKDNPQPPPHGALVFFLYGSSKEYSHVTFSKGDGTELSTPDAYDESAVHVETIAQHDSKAYSKYVGWWLFA